jgi:hypothetical protein
MITIEKVQERYGFDYYVYQGVKLVRVCPSYEMARTIAATLINQ